MAKITNRSLRQRQAQLPGDRQRTARAGAATAPTGSTRTASREQNTFASSHGLDWTHTFDSHHLPRPQPPPELLRLHGLRLLRTSTTRATTPPGRPRAATTTSDGAIIQGVELTQYLQQTQRARAQGFGGQPGRRREPGQGRLRAAACPRSSSARRATSTSAPWTACDSLVRHENEPPDFPGVQVNYPVIGAAFVQDQIEWSDLTVRAGVRLDYFDARSTMPSDLANPANAIAGAPRVGAAGRRRVKATLSPRLGVAYPDRGQGGHPLRLRPLLPVPVDRRHLRELRLRRPAQPAGRRASATA